MQGDKGSVTSLSKMTGMAALRANMMSTEFQQAQTKRTWGIHSIIDMIASSLR